jgi:hypothetical protein
MSKARLKRILLLTLLGMLPVFTLVLVSEKQKGYDPESFQRNIVNAKMKRLGSLELSDGAYYVAGTIDSSVYLTENKNGNLLAFTPTLQKKSINLTIDGSIWTQGMRTYIDSPYVYLTDGITPALFYGKVSNWILRPYVNDSVYFKSIVPLKPSSFVLKSQSNIKKRDILLLQNTNPFELILHDQLLQKQIDGSFCTDGMMHFCKSLSRFVYVYYYRNEYFCTDTSMRLLYRGHTIDTVSRAQITLDTLHSGSVAMTTPPLLVNRKSRVAGKYLLVNSNLRSRSDGFWLFKTSSVIDVYDLAKGSYTHSFYIPDYRGKKPSDFIIANSVLYVLYQEALVAYTNFPVHQQ